MEAVKTILLLEDDGQFREELCLTLRDALYEVHDTEDLQQALALAQRNRYDLMLTDIRLPGQGDGIEALRQVRQTRYNQDLPGIIMTGFNDNAAALRALYSGAQGYLHKPFQTAELYTAIDSCFSSQQEASQVHSAFQGILRIFSLDEKSKEEKKERSKDPFFQKIQHHRQELFSTFCTGLQMNLKIEKRDIKEFAPKKDEPTRLERFLYISAAQDIWFKLRPLEKANFRFLGLTLEQAQHLATQYEEVANSLNTLIRNQWSGSGVYPKEEGLPKETFLRFLRRIEEHLITPAEVSYSWCLWELPLKTRESYSLLRQLHQLAWGETLPDHRRRREAKEFLDEAELKRLPPSQV